MAEMERAYGSWPLGEDPEFQWVWGDYKDGAEDDIDCMVDDVDISLSTWMDERRRTDVALGALPGIGAISKTNGRTVRWSLAKLLGEYARYNGHADIIRQRIDGRTGGVICHRRFWLLARRRGETATNSQRTDARDEPSHLRPIAGGVTMTIAFTA
jgi:hypothetical protein